MADHLATRVQLKSQYSATYFSKDTVYWKSLIEQLQKTAPRMLPACKLGYWGFIVDELLLRRASLCENNLAALSQILFIYQHADPTNAEQAFMHIKLFY